MFQHGWICGWDMLGCLFFSFPIAMREVIKRLFSVQGCMEELTSSNSTVQVISLYVLTCFVLFLSLK